MLLLTEGASIRENICHNKYFPYGPNSRLIRALLYTHTSKTTKSQCFLLLLWTKVQPIHTPVRTRAYGPALSQSNFSILSAFCLVYNKAIYGIHFDSSILHVSLCFVIAIVLAVILFTKCYTNGKLLTH